MAVFGGYSKYKLRPDEGDTTDVRYRDFRIVPHSYSFGANYNWTFKKFIFGIGFSIQRLKMIEDWANQGGWFRKEEYTEYLLTIPISAGYKIYSNSNIRIIPLVGISTQANIYYKYQEKNPANNDLYYTEQGFTFDGVNVLNAFAELQLKYNFKSTPNLLGIYMNYSTQARKKRINNKPWGMANYHYHSISVGLRYEYMVNKKDCDCPTFD